MNSRTLTGLLLIVSPIVAAASWFTYGAILGNPDPENAQAMIGALAQHADGAKWTISIATLAFLAVAGGLAGIKESMSGGSGHQIMGLGLLIFVISLAGAVAEGAFVIGTAQAAAGGNMPVAGSLYGASNAIGGLTTVIGFVGLTVIGASFLVQKNVNVIIGALFTLIGIVGLVISVANDYPTWLLVFAWVPFMLITLVIGVVHIKAKS